MAAQKIGELRMDSLQYMVVYIGPWNGEDDAAAAGFQNFDRSSRFGAEREFCGEIFDLFWEERSDEFLARVREGGESFAMPRYAGGFWRGRGADARKRARAIFARP